MIAEVSIKDHEASGNSAPSSFKEFAETNLNSPAVATLISSISLFTNTCILAFGVVRAGSILESLLPVESNTMTLAATYTAVLGAMLATSSREQLSGVASAVVTVLFTSFVGLLIPGLASIHDPVAAFLAPGTSTDVTAAALQAAPIIFSTMVFQNIVPSVTKILNYDRLNTIVAIVIGSSIPTLMYFAWCFACVGGDTNPVAGVGGPLVSAFSAAAVTGSCIGCGMSLSEELDSFLQPSQAEREGFSVPVVALSVGVPLAAAFMFAGGEDFSVALKMAGAYGSPLLYGAIPVLMAWTQREKSLANTNDLVPGGLGTLSAVGVLTAAFVLQQLSSDLAGLFAQ
mmetsp:Transcript_11375/g.26397  ORF Transcript_11375/g.26397 Transcript_11375/m.26397 type:complete len:343 (-) Transcript_11375:171-1199(-)